MRCDNNCSDCVHWEECTSNHGSSFMGRCKIWKEINGKEYVDGDSEACENWLDVDDFNFGEPWHKENLPDFPLEEGNTYYVPLKLVGKERRFDGGRGTEFYIFGLDRNRQCITFADYNLPKNLKNLDS